MPSAPTRVLWIKDDRPGHINKVRGFIASLQNVLPMEVRTWDVRWRWSPLRHLVGRLNGTCLTPPPSLVIRDFPPAGDCDLIISSGGLTQWPNALLAKRLRVPNVYIGSPHHFRPEAFSLIPMTDPPHENPPFLKLELVPSVVSPESARRSAAEHFPDADGGAWTLLIGGDGEGMKWMEAEYMSLARRFMEEARTAGRKVFVATSRRTPERIENALRDFFESRDGFLTGAWFHSAGGKTLPLLALFGASNRIVVTADSVSMTNEAVAAGVPTVAVYPSGGAPKPRHEAQFRLLENEGKLARAHLAGELNLTGIQPTGGWRLLTGGQQAALAELALDRLGLPRP